jgi:hypothetical protein
MRRQSASPLTALRFGRRTARLPQPLRLFHRARDAHRKQQRDFPAGTARQNRRRNPFPQIIRIMPTHPMLTSNPAISLNQIFNRAGTPKRFTPSENDSKQ